MTTGHSHRFSEPPSTLGVALRGRCPRCGEGRLFAGFLKLAPRCTVCGLSFDFADSGDGPAVFVMLLAGFIVTGGALFTEITYQPPYWVHAVLWGPLAILVPLIMLRPLKAGMIALQFRHKAQEGRLADTDDY